MIRTLMCRRRGEYALAAALSTLAMILAPVPVALSGEKAGQGSAQEAEEQQSPRAFLPFGAAKDIPQIQLTFVGLDDKGQPQPWPVKSLRLAAADGSWRWMYILKGRVAMRIAVGAAQGSRQLVAGKKYKTQGLPIAREFTAPEGVKPGEISEIELIVADARQQAKATPPPKPKPPTIEGTMKGLPQEELRADPVRLIAVYHDGRRRYRAQLGTDGTFAFRGAPLGGELLVCLRDERSCLAYVGKVSKPRIVLPDESDYARRNGEAVTFTLRYQQKDLPPDSLGLGFYVNDKARLFLAACSLRTDGKTPLRVRLMPGKYCVRAITRRGPRNPNQAALQSHGPIVMREVTVSAETRELSIVPDSKR